jgi:glycosyltransferase involved in cell wall biosynthesis
MLNDKTIALVISAYNEETQLSMVLDAVPDFVDRIIIVNDCSKDKTEQVALPYVERFRGKGLRLAHIRDGLARTQMNRADVLTLEIYEAERKNLPRLRTPNTTPEVDRVILLNHEVNSGKGAAVATGFEFCRQYAIDCTVTIDGDGQMDLCELEKICSPIVRENIDFVKGNRLSHRAAQVAIPFIRYFGNSVLSILTKVASGYWSVTDAQTGYTAMHKRALALIPLDKIYRRYGVPNDLLVKMNIIGATVREVDIKPVYGVGEQSKMKIGKVIPRISKLLIKSFFVRLWTKYFFKSFHPLFLLYNFGFVLLAVSVVFLGMVSYSLVVEGLRPPIGNYFAFALSFIVGFQSLMFAMWMDIQDNEKLLK